MEGFQTTTSKRLTVPHRAIIVVRFSARLCAAKFSAEHRENSLADPHFIRPSLCRCWDNLEHLPRSVEHAKLGLVYKSVQIHRVPCFTVRPKYREEGCKVEGKGEVALSTQKVLPAKCRAHSGFCYVDKGYYCTFTELRSGWCCDLPSFLY